MNQWNWVDRLVECEPEVRADTPAVNWEMRMFTHKILCLFTFDRHLNVNPWFCCLCWFYDWKTCFGRARAHRVRAHSNNLFPPFMSRSNITKTNYLFAHTPHWMAVMCELSRAHCARTAAGFCVCPSRLEWNIEIDNKWNDETTQFNRKTNFIWFWKKSVCEFLRVFVWRLFRTKPYSRWVIRNTKNTEEQTVDL